MPRLKIHLSSAKDVGLKKSSDKANREGFRVAVYEIPEANVYELSRYEGEFRADKKDGRGVESELTGVVYEGGWAQGKKHGNGVLTKTLCDGRREVLYSGLYIRGKPGGYGRKRFPDGSVYEGEFKNGALHGIGRMEYPDGSLYFGYWKKDQRDGVGRYLEAAKGILYEGEFKEGQKCGQGRQYYLRKGVIQEGVWRDGRPEVSFFMDDNLRRSVAADVTPYRIQPLRLKYPNELYTARAQQVLDSLKNIENIKTWETCS